MNNQEEKERVSSSSDFCCCCSWVLFFHREQMMASATNERRRCDARALAMMMIRFSRRGISKFVRSPWNHHHHLYHHHIIARVKKEYFKARTKNVLPSLRCQSIFACVRIFPRGGVPVDLTERLAPRRRTVMMMIPMMLHLFVSLSFCPFKGTVRRTTERDAQMLYSGRASRRRTEAFAKKVCTKTKRNRRFETRRRRRRRPCPKHQQQQQQQTPGDVL